MTKKRYVIGDIHNSALALKQVLERADFDYEHDELYCVGDYVDGWPDAYETIEELLKIKNLHLVRGNHDQWFEEFYSNNEMELTEDLGRDIWIKQGGLATLESYENQPKNNRMKQAKRFWRKLKDYIITEDNILIVHAGWTKVYGFQSTAKWAPHSLYWDRDIWYDRLYLKELLDDEREVDEERLQLEGFKHIYIGHTAVSGLFRDDVEKVIPITVGNMTNMDTGAGWYGKLSLMDMDNGYLFQSDLVSTLYPNAKGRG